MKPPPFDYAAPATVDEAVALLASRGGNAKIIAGGQSLMPMLAFRLAAPDLLVDLKRLQGLDRIDIGEEGVRLGAKVRWCDIERDARLKTAHPLLSEAVKHIAHYQIRNRGTIGGSLAHADPAADLPCAVCALDATLVLQGPAGQRRVPATDFFRGYFETALAPDEMLLEVRVPRAADAPWAYEKFVRRANDWAIVAVAVCDGRIALANMGMTPLRASASEGALAGGSSVEDAAALAADGTEPTTDAHADPAYRGHLARLLTRRALTAAAAR